MLKAPKGAFWYTHLMSDIEYNRVTTATYNQIARDYAERDKSPDVDEKFIVQDGIDAFISVLPPHGKVLDIGVGAGRDSRYLYKHGLNVTGIDSSKEMINLSKVSEPGIHYIQMDMEEISLAANSFDGVWANASLHHIPKSHLATVLQSICRVLRSNGHFQLIVKHGEGEGIRENDKFDRKVKRYFAFYSKQELEGAVTSAGFNVIRSSVELAGEWVYLLAQKA